MNERTRRREFRRESFASVRDWVHFCVEFELKLCAECRERARISIAAPADWTCRRCTAQPPSRRLPLHPDLWRALVDGEETRTTCPVCHQGVMLRDCWISEDARRLYCADHLRPIETADRLRRSRAFLRSQPRPETVSPPRAESLSQLEAHLRGDRCAACAFNGTAVYAGERLVEVDGDRRRCTSAPDALNCADVEH